MPCMNELICVFSATITLFLGCFAFMYYLMAMFEKRIETKIDTKIDHLTEKIDSILVEQASQRKRSDHLYEILINLVNDLKNPRSNP